LSGDVVKNIGSLLAQSFSNWNENNAPRLGAALAFYTILSISPLVIFVIGIVSLVFNRTSAENLLLAQVHSLVGESGREAVQGLLASGQRHADGIFSSVLGLITLVFGASGVFTELRSALNTIWKVPPAPGSGLWVMVRERLFSFGMVLSVGFILLVSLLASAGLAAMTKFFSGLLPIGDVFWQLLNFIVSLAGIAVLFGLILKYVPETQIAWRDVRVGALLTALLFNLGKLLLAFYLGKTSPGSSYGAAGSLVVVVIWVYYSAQIFFFGAELTHVYALSQRKGSRANGFEATKAA
jgi:membrane protein